MIGCTDRAIRKRINAGALPSQQRMNERNRPEYVIPLSALPAAAQQRYYTEHLPPAPKTKAVKAGRSLEQYSAGEREQIALWTGLLEDWQQYRAKPGANKAEVDELFVTKCRLEHPTLHISTDILYRRWKALREGDLDGLVDKRGKARKGRCEVPRPALDMFLAYYLDEAQHPIARCREFVSEWARQQCPDALPLASYDTYRRKALEVPYAVRVLCREGAKAYYDKCSPYIRREYESIQANDWWVGDTHTLDVISRGPDGQLHRLYLSAWLDARSGIFTGWYITDQPSSQSTLNALRKGIEKYGIPENVYVDNGREFLTYDIGGRGHRAKKKMADGSEPFAPPPVFARLGIKMTNAIVRNARAKLVERRFEDFKNSVSRLFATYTGGNVVEKPDRLKHVLKTDKVPTDAEVRATVETLIEGYLNCQPYGGSVAEDKGKRRIDVHFSHCGKMRKAAPEDLRLLLMRTSRPVRVGRRGVSVKIGGQSVEFYGDEFVAHWQNKQVYVRYDPEHLETARVYDLEDRYITELPQNALAAGYFAAQEQIAEMQKAKRKAERYVRDYAKTLALPDDAQTADDLMKAMAERNIMALPAWPGAKAIEIVRATEEPILRAVGDIDLDTMSRNAKKRNNGGTYHDESL